jgi:hypothetical protein
MRTFKRTREAQELELGHPTTATLQRQSATEDRDGWSISDAQDDQTSTDARVERAEPTERLLQMPSGSLVDAVTRHKLLICACALILALAGLALGSARRQTFTSSATLQVGQVNPNSPGFYGYVQSAAALATAFSRAIDAAPVLNTINTQLQIAPATAIARLSAEPLPASPAFRVIATGPTQASAVALANTSANAIILYESQTNSANPAAAALLHEYHGAGLALQRAIATVERLRHDHLSSASALQSAEVARSTASVRLRALETAYTGAVTSQAPRSGLVSLLAGATAASSDRRAKLELYGFVGLLAGAILGCAIALGLQDRVAKRRAAASIETETSGPQAA